MGNFKDKAKPTVLEGGISKNKAQADLVSGEDPLLAAQVMYYGRVLTGRKGAEPTHFNDLLNNHD